MFAAVRDELGGETGARIGFRPGWRLLGLKVRRQLQRKIAVDL